LFSQQQTDTIVRKLCESITIFR